MKNITPLTGQKIPFPNFFTDFSAVIDTFLETEWTDAENRNLKWIEHDLLPEIDARMKSLERLQKATKDVPFDPEEKERLWGEYSSKELAFNDHALTLKKMNKKRDTIERKIEGLTIAALKKGAQEIDLGKLEKEIRDLKTKENYEAIAQRAREAAATSTILYDQSRAALLNWKMTTRIGRMSYLQELDDARAACEEFLESRNTDQTVKTDSGGKIMKPIHS